MTRRILLPTGAAAPGATQAFDGRIPYDAFVERTDPALVALERDVGNLTRAGRVDLRRILSAVPNPDESSFFVEHRADPDAPFESVRRSFDHIASLAL